MVEENDDEDDDDEDEDDDNNAQHNQTQGNDIEDSNHYHDASPEPTKPNRSTILTDSPTLPAFLLQSPPPAKPRKDILPPLPSVFPARPDTPESHEEHKPPQPTLQPAPQLAPATRTLQEPFDPPSQYTASSSRYRSTSIYDPSTSSSTSRTLSDMPSLTKDHEKPSESALGDTSRSPQREGFFSSPISFSDHKQLAEENTKLRSELAQLQNELGRQQDITRQVRDETRQLLAEMREIAKSEEDTRKTTDLLSAEVTNLQEQITHWKKAFAKAKAQLKSYRQSGIPDKAHLYSADMLVRRASLYITDDGAIPAPMLSEFHIAINDFIQSYREEYNTKTMLSTLQTLVSVIRSIINSALDAEDQQHDPEIRTEEMCDKITQLTGNLMTITRGMASSNGMYPMSVCNAAVADLCAAVTELITAVKIRKSISLDSSTAGVPEPKEEEKADNEGMGSPMSECLDETVSEITNNRSSELSNSVNDMEEKLKNLKTEEATAPLSVVKNGVSETTEPTRPIFGKAHDFNDFEVKENSIPENEPEVAAFTVEPTLRRKPTLVPLDLKPLLNEPQSLEYPVSANRDITGPSLNSFDLKGQIAQSKLESAQSYANGLPSADAFKDDSKEVIAAKEPPVDVSVLKLRKYLEEITVVVVESIQDLLTVIRQNLKYPELSGKVHSILKMVRDMITHSQEALNESHNAAFKSHAGWIIKSLEDCCTRMNDIDVSATQKDRSDMQFQQRLAGVSFDLAKTMKELVRIVDEFPELKTETPDLR
ncbi:hypothetical protein CANCADRAFT_32120 [Tortispora caseinolytica NRRL Y-17796]|uniref:GIT Spa2 homology (SHD) domain-containing protein n=1 Tax=Tortispora caseinolytica NRRL Y-17796 TaxID=767744 RepID=A0A1E4T9V5_9ASCO|nr:hypothetical protein CANCADRAFT_32120 [Tortispora caseinolytica NRRL Y-17796]